MAVTTGVIAAVGYVTTRRDTRKAASAARANATAQYNFDMKSAQSSLDLANMNYGDVAQYASGLAGSADSLYKASQQMKQAANQALELAHANAKLIDFEGSENIERTGTEQEWNQGLALAFMGASGSRVDQGSQASFFDNMQEQDASLLTFMRKATDSRMDIEIAKGEYEKQMGLANASSLFSSAQAAGAQASFMIAQARTEIAAAQAYLANLKTVAPPGVTPPTAATPPTVLTGKPSEIGSISPSTFVPQGGDGGGK